MNYDFYDDMSLINGYMPYMENDNNKKLDLFNPYEGYLKGNAFRDQYIPYKNYKVAKINFNSEKEELMFNISEYAFMMHEMNLYLDVYPDDIQAIGLYNQYKEEANNLQNEYESRYGRISLGINEDFNWDWVKSPWPWERI